MYDARRTTPEIGGNGIFALALVVVGALAFGLVWVLSSPAAGSGSGRVPALHANVPPTLAEKMPSRDEVRFLNAMARLQPAALAPLDSALDRQAGDRVAQIESISESASMAVFANLDSLAHVSTGDLNAMLDTLILQVGSAKSERSALCNGRTWAQFENADAERFERWMLANGYTHERMYPDSMVLMADFMEALASAKSNPSRHGSFRNSDQKALEQAMFGLMSNPDIMQAMAGGGSQAEQLARVNVCGVVETLLVAVRDLPDGTKGRAWAAAFDRPEFTQALDQLQKLGF